LLTPKQITCKAFYTAIKSLVSIGVNTIPVLGLIKAAGVTVAIQAAEVMAYTFSERKEAQKHYGDWLRDSAGGDSEPPNDTEKPSTGLMDTICGNEHTDDAAETILNLHDGPNCSKLRFGSQAICWCSQKMASSLRAG
jgi:hypothetical protein